MSISSEVKTIVQSLWTWRMNFNPWMEVEEYGQVAPKRLSSLVPFQTGGEGSAKGSAIVCDLAYAHESSSCASDPVPRQIQTASESAASGNGAT